MTHYKSQMSNVLRDIAKLSSSWQSSASRTDLALNLEITTPTPTHPRESRDPA